MLEAGETPPFPHTRPYHLCSQAIMCVRASGMTYNVGASLSFWNRARFFRLFSPSLRSAVLPLSSALRVRSSSCLLPGCYTVI